MRWNINKNGTNTGEVFDDGVPLAQPGDPEFNRDLIDAHLLTLTPKSATWTADYMGQSWPAPEPEPDPDPE